MKLLFLIFAIIPFTIFAQKANDLGVYDYYALHQKNEPKQGFIVLSDMFPFDEFKGDNNIIAPEHLGEFEFSNDNYHELKGENRDRFLGALKIQETDFLFVNNLNLNKIKSFKVSQLKLTAFLSPYRPDITVHNWDYLIGFELGSVQMPFNPPDIYGQTIFSCVGAKNPFNQGKAEPMKWKKVNQSEFIWKLEKDETPKHMLDIKYKSVYKFKWSKLNYYVREIYAGDFLYGYYLVVTKSKSGEKVNSMLFFESEGTYLQPLNGQKNSSGDLQFTGYIFKDKPPIIYGFQSNSFGCPYISFADDTDNYLWLKCDNRH